MTATETASVRGDAGAGHGPLAGVVGACRRAFAGVAAFSFFVNALVLVVPLYMVQVFDRVMTSRSEDTLIVLTVAALAAFAVMAVLDLVRARMLVRIGVWLDATLAKPLMAAALSGAGGARASAQPLRDLASVRAFVTGPGIVALLDAPWVPLFVGLVFVLDATLGVAALIGAGLLVAVAIANELATRAPLAAANARWVETMAGAECAVRQADAVGALGMAGSVADRWAAAGADAVAVQALASDRAGTFAAAGRFVRLGLQIVVMALAATLVIHDQLSAGAMIAASVMIGRALAPVEQAIGLWRQVVGARAACGRLRAALAPQAEARPWMPLPRPRGRLECAGLAIVPPGAERPLVRDLDLTLEPGRMLGITGPSGAGKSTLVRCLVGAVAPAAGAVRLDGVDVHAWPADARGRHVGYVPQIVEMVPGTVAENIARFTDAAPERVVAAAEAARVHDLVKRLPAGYETRIGGPNDVLSAGARQRIALARALFGDPALLVLDEPYSNLDTEGVEALLDALAAARDGGAAVVLVAHRPSVLAHADRVLRLEGGAFRILEQRSPAQLSVVADGDGEPPRRTPRKARAAR